MHTTRTSHTLTLAASLLLLAACTKEKTGEYGSIGASTGASAAAATPAPPPAPTLTDPNIVYILDEANAADSARGKLASTKGTNEEVRDFGKMMMGEHHALRVMGAKLATKLSVTPEAPTGDESATKTQAGLADLNATPKGAAWDKSYIDYEVTVHEQVLETAGRAKDAAQNAELKKLLEDAAPILQKHLDRAKAIQTKLATSTT